MDGFNEGGFNVYALLVSRIGIYLLQNLRISGIKW